MQDVWMTNSIVVSRVELLVYLLLAVILGWAIKSMLRRTWLHRPWEHSHKVVQHNHQTAPVATTHTHHEDDLSIISGISESTEYTLKERGILTLRDLAHTPLAVLRSIIEEDNIQNVDPTTWAHQAYMGVHGQWDELESYQNFLEGR
jgi:hypothetical protein